MAKEEEDLEWLDTREYKQARREVGDYIQQHPQGVRIAELNREFPAHVRVIFGILESLQIEGKIYCEEWRPAPTVYYPGDRTLKQPMLSRREVSTQIYNYRNGKKKREMVP